jgi:chromosome segregation ATPase
MAANEASVDTLQTSHKVLQNECEILRAGVEHAEFENKALAAVFCEAKDKHAIELSTLEQALHKRIDQLSDCEQELAVSRLELNTKDAEGEQLMTELEMAKFAVDESRVMHATTRRENESLRQEDESLRQDNEALSSALADAITEQENVWKTAQFFKEELEEQASKFVHERAAWSTWENERNEYDKRTTMLQKELEISDRKLNIVS